VRPWQRLNSPQPLPLAGPSGDTRSSVSEDSLPTRRSLLSRLRDLGDSESWRTFFETYWRLIYNVARKSGLSDDQAQDVVQETVIAVARKIPEFRYDPAKGSFKQWLLLICRRRIHDQLRRIYSSRQLPLAGTEDLAGAAENVAYPAPPPDARLDEAWEGEWRENIFQMALDRVRQQANPKHYQVFDCCVLQSMRAPEVARMLGLSAAQVYLAKHRISAAVKRAAKAVEAELGGRTTD
jgi:RNA polymerase sigma factor (sigma-70 family)